MLSLLDPQAMVIHRPLGWCNTNQDTNLLEEAWMAHGQAPRPGPGTPNYEAPQYHRLQISLPAVPTLCVLDETSTEKCSGSSSTPTWPFLRLDPTTLDLAGQSASSSNGFAKNLLCETVGSNCLLSNSLPHLLTVTPKQKQLYSYIP